MLARLLSPFDADLFLRHYRAREHFRIERASPDYYNDLVRVADIDAVLQSGHLPAASVNVVKEGVRVPIEEWSRVETGARGAGQVAIPERLLDLYSGGASLILNQAHCTLPKLSDACGMLARELGFPTQANIYISPGNAVAFTKHTDEHEVLVLQIAGSKSWIVYPAGAPPVDVVLRSGDLLYVPRGMAHAARSGHEDSIHITLGLKPVYGFELIRDLAAMMSGMEEFQRPEPPLLAGGGAVETFETEFLARLQTMLAQLKPADLTRLRRERLLTNQGQGWLGRFSDLRLVHLMTPGTMVRRRPGIIADVKRDGMFLHIQFAGRRVTVPVFMRDELHRVLGDASFAIDDIGGMITRAGKIRFIAEFVHAGLLQIIQI